MAEQQIVRGSTTLSVVTSGATLSATLEATKTLVQSISGGMVVSADWTEDGPVIYPDVRSSNTTANITAFQKVDWYYDNVLITGEDSRFEITTYRVGSVDLPALRIKANLGLEMESRKRVFAEMSVDAGGYTDTVTASTEVSRENVSASTYIPEIAMTNGGVVTTDVPEITLAANLYQGGQPVSGYTAEWYKVVANDTVGEEDGLEPLGKSGTSITLTKDDIDLMQTILVLYKVGGLTKATATADVRDETDPYEMLFEHSNAGGVVDKVNGCTTTARVVVAHTQEEVAAFKMFAFSLFNGTELIRSQGKGQTNQFKTEYADLRNNNIRYVRLEVEASVS